MEALPILLDGVDDAPGEPHTELTGSTDNVGEDVDITTETTIWGVVGGIPTLGMRPRKKRGRHAKDPLAQSVYFQCSRLEELEHCLREYLASPIHPAEHTTLEFTFPVTAAFMIPAREIHAKHGMGDPHESKVPVVYSLFKKSAVSVVDSLYNIPDSKEQMIVQKGIAKALVDSISSIDGFHYSFHNNWLSNADQANRFSYYCNDSVLNKGRAANEGISKIRNNIKIRKPVYACEGGIWIKFSVTKNNLEIQYKHIPMHPTFDATAPLPRNGSKRRRLMEIFHPELLPGAIPRVKKQKPPKPLKPLKEPKAPKEPRKRKTPRDSNGQRRATEPISQANNAWTPQSAPERESSLQPLFDFLGSAARLEQSGGAISGSATPGERDACATESEPPIPIESDEEMTDCDRPPDSLDPAQPFPGMLSGFMNNKEIRWGNKPGPRPRKIKKIAQGFREQQHTQNSAAPPATSMLPVPTAIPQGNDTALMPASSSEMEALKRRLLEAEEKIRSLEAQKSQQLQNTPNRAKFAGTPQQYLTPPQPHHPPAQHPHPPPPGQWQYPPPRAPAHPPYRFSYAPPAQWAPHPSQPSLLSSRPPLPAPPSSHPHLPSLPSPVPGPPPPAAVPAPSATSSQVHDQAAQILPQPVQPNPRPSYGFIPNPAEFIATKIRPHLLPSAQSAQSMPGRVSILPALPFLPTPEPPQEYSLLPQLHAHAAWPSQAPSPPVQSLAQGQGQFQLLVPRQPQPLRPVAPAETSAPPPLTIVQERPHRIAPPVGNGNYHPVLIPQSPAPLANRAVAQSHFPARSRETTTDSRSESRVGMLSFLPSPPQVNPLAVAASAAMTTQATQVDTTSRSTSTSASESAH